MATNTEIAFDEAAQSTSSKLAAYQVTEDGKVKKLSRAVLSDSTGAELGTVGNPLNITGAGSGTSDSTEATQLLVKTAVEAANVLYGAVTETAPATDTASSGHNGRLQRIAQRITSLIALLPTALTAGGNLKVAINEAIAAGAAIIGKVGIDQTTPGTTNAVYPTEVSDVIDLTLSLDTSAYAAGDVLAATQEIAGVARVNAGTADLGSLAVVDKDDQGAPIDFIFFKTNVSLGTENAAPSISDADAAEYLGHVSIETSDYLDLGGVKVATLVFQKPIKLKAGAASTSVYIAAMTRGTPTHTASGITMKLGIARL